MLLALVTSPNDRIIEQLQTRLVGDLFCYRHCSSYEIETISLKDLKYTNQINLKSLIPDKHMLKYVSFDGIKESSNLRFIESH